MLTALIPLLPPPPLPPPSVLRAALSHLPKTYLPGLRSSPWHSPDEWPAEMGLHHVAQALRDAVGGLADEYWRLRRDGVMEREAECIHSPRGGAWTHLSINVPWLERDGDGCAVDTPAACALIRSIASMKLPAVQVLRAGYSAVEGRAHLLPHYGMTNGQLKFHVGVITPMRAETGLPCCAIRVGNETREWRRGAVLMFDDSWDHEVWNDCTGDMVARGVAGVPKATDPHGRDADPALRVVFQLVIVHPDLTATGGGGGGGRGLFAVGADGRSAPAGRQGKAAAAGNH